MKNMINTLRLLKIHVRKNASYNKSHCRKKVAIKEANVSKHVSVIAKQRSQSFEELEQLLLFWPIQK